MGFWIFMFVMDMMVPLIMIGFGKYFQKSAPKEINLVFGYRTSMSMKNRDTWEFAHKYCGKIWYKYGLALLVVSVSTLLFTIGKNENIVGTAGGILCTLQIICLIGSIYPTEKALRQNFDSNGKRHCN